jgi:hypothetical protein
MGEEENGHAHNLYEDSPSDINVSIRVPELTIPDEERNEESIFIAQRKDTTRMIIKNKSPNLFDLKHTLSPEELEEIRQYKSKVGLDKVFPVCVNNPMKSWDDILSQLEESTRDLKSRRLDAYRLVRFLQDPNHSIKT